MRPFFLLFFTALSFSSFSQQRFPTVELFAPGTKVSLRGLSALNEVVVWASGSKGTIGRTANGGKTWSWMTVKGFEQRDFRDIEALSATEAVVIAVDTPAIILKTTNAGRTWRVVYENRSPGMFLDALDFITPQQGIVVGDPIDGKIFLARTDDGGVTWRELEAAQRPVVDSGEALFAASGTNIKWLAKDAFALVTGGTRSRFYHSQLGFNALPIVQGKETTGANGFDTWTEKNFSKLIVAGGDFNEPASDSSNIFWSTNRGNSWTPARKSPTGYRSAVRFLSKTHVVTCGLSGVDYSVDGGKTWTGISTQGFHTVSVARRGTAVFFAGGGGKVGKLSWEPKPRR